MGMGKDRRFFVHGAAVCFFRWLGLMKKPICSLFLCSLLLAAGQDWQSRIPFSVARGNPPRAGALGKEKDLFPPELVDFVAEPQQPVFRGAGPGHWDVRIRERGWIMREGDGYRMWYTGFDRDGSSLLKLGYATSPDGIHWTRYDQNPIYDQHWVEDMMVVKHQGSYYMFAEGKDDQAQMLTSPDGIQWTRVGQLDVRKKNGEPIELGPYGTPTVWAEDNVWYLFYERRDLGIWVATSKDMKVWTNVKDEPVIPLGPADYDKEQIALNQIIKYHGRYYAYYHGAGSRLPGTRKRLWCTCVATSTDLMDWQKYEKNPLFPLEENKSSGILVHDGQRYLLYTMHDQVIRHVPRQDTKRKAPDPGSYRRREESRPLRIRAAGPEIVHATVTGPTFYAPDLLQSFEEYHHPRLKRLREEYRLEEVVQGESDEFRRLLKLRHWVHQRWQFDFNQNFKGDAFAILEKAKTGCGFNCAHSMTVLHAVLSSMGYVSRYVLVDRNHEDLGCSRHHGVNEVWSNDYAKWVLFDAQYDCHFERDGIPLSALELHEAVRANEGRDIVLVRGVDRRPVLMAPKTGPQPHEASIFSYWWVCYPQRQNPFTQPHYTTRERLIVFDNEAFRQTTWYRGPANNLKKHWAYSAGVFLPTADRTQIEWTPNVPELRLFQVETGEIEVEIRSATPNFKAYVVRVNDGEPHLCEEGRVRWKLKPGTNVLQVRCRNLFGIDGPRVISQITFKTTDGVLQGKVEERP